MEAIVKVVTEFFMMVLCVTSAAVDQPEIRIGLVGDHGYIDTMIVRREEVGFTVHEEMNGKLVQSATIVPKDGTDNVFIWTDKKGNSETIDLAQEIEGFNVTQLRANKRLRLKTSNGVGIAIVRSDNVTFITPDQMKTTYVVH